MPDDKVAVLPASGSGDANGSQAGAGKAKHTEPIAKDGQAKAGSLTSLVPDVKNAPKGEVALGAKAGAFGPWRAHQIIDGTASEIARRVRGLVVGTTDPRVLVVGDQSLLPSDWAARNTQTTLTRLSARIAALQGDIDLGQVALGEAIGRYEHAEPASAPVLEESQPSRRRRGKPEAVATEAAAPPAAGGLPAGALGAAVGLLDLLRTDYTITATAVTAAPSELATLTAGHLAARPAAPAGEANKPSGEANSQAGNGNEPAGAGNDAPLLVKVEADAFATMRPSPVMASFAEVIKARDQAVATLVAVQARLAPAQAELDSINGRITLVEQAWASATADSKDDAAIAQLRLAVDQLAGQASEREKAAGPAGVLVGYAQQVIADTDAALAALVQNPAGGEAPLLTAARRERLDAAVTSEKITHVLYVNLDAVAADAVTRRSVLGASGRIQFLSAGNASWLLLDTLSGTIAGGDQVSLADVMTFSLENGNAQFKPNGVWLEAADIGGVDPLTALETWGKVLVAVLVLVLLALGVLSFLAVIKTAVG